jgi:hypothetical protein
MAAKRVLRGNWGKLHMRISKSGHDIQSVEDWFTYAPPKKGILQWEDNRSAKELARSWFRKGLGSPPDEMRELLERNFQTEIVFDEVKPECVIKLDDFAGEHRNCDLVVTCNVGKKRMVINLEAKADEPSGDLIGEYYDQMLGSRSKVPQRITQLSLALFGHGPDTAVRRLRYQLLHATAATLVEAKENEACMALFLVHEFWSATLNKNKLTQNRNDWENFVRTFPELDTTRFRKNQILGPVLVPGNEHIPSLPLYLGKLVTELE